MPICVRFVHCGWTEVGCWNNHNNNPFPSIDNKLLGPLSSKYISFLLDKVDIKQRNYIVKLNSTCFDFKLWSDKLTPMASVGLWVPKL